MRNFSWSLSGLSTAVSGEIELSLLGNHIHRKPLLPASIARSHRILKYETYGHRLRSSAGRLGRPHPPRSSSRAVGYHRPPELSAPHESRQRGALSAESTAVLATISALLTVNFQDRQEQLRLVNLLCALVEQARLIPAHESRWVTARRALTPSSGSSGPHGAGLPQRPDGDVELRNTTPLRPRSAPPTVPEWAERLR